LDLGFVVGVLGRQIGHGRRSEVLQAGEAVVGGLEDGAFDGTGGKKEQRYDPPVDCLGHLHSLARGRRSGDETPVPLVRASGQNR